MGVQEEHDSIVSGKGENQVRAMKEEAEELKEFYKKLKSQNDSHHRSIVGLTTEKEDVRMRIRALLNKRQAAEGPDFDEYQIQRRVSKTYEPIDHQRRKSSSTRRPVMSTTAEVTTEKTVLEHEPEVKSSMPASITVTLNTN
ncbi:uncharacterized protein LOC130644754 [Hydractinia symbiolongicarpus]|uniref:uncharacterized protein LOC130644754 n=1 Tax=Hydractinia symbiolongicarpus TaxID=13093 RepID=UPI00254D31EB|nr:uncharacterized protein LOC130644754 [Hydractinia symbiolongicarpus]